MLFGWVCKIYEGWNQWGAGDKDNWKGLDVKKPAGIPVLIDSMWCGSNPSHYDIAPEYERDVASVGNLGSMKRFCINRHDGAVNCVFADFSVRSGGLKELWKLKWHRRFNTNLGPVNGKPYPAGWPDWMKRYD